MSKLEVELKSCHNDTIVENFIKSDNDRIYLIDWEYVDVNYPMWDLATHYLENSFTQEEGGIFVKYILKLKKCNLKIILRYRF